MEDAALEELLKKLFLNGFQKFQSYVQYLKLAQAEHLNQCDGFAKVLNIDSSKQNIK